MPNSESIDNISSGGFYIGDAQDVTIQAGGDIVAGNKTIIQNIIQQTAEKIVTAPYKFLASYDISDRDIFFGRTAVIEELAGRIPRHKALIINGQSGSGKTSLINAGLIPRLVENGYVYVSFRDYSDPIRQLRDYLTQHEEFKLDQAQSLPLLRILQEVSLQQKSRIVIFLDQFERFFLSVDSKLRSQFIQEVRVCMEGVLSAEEMNFVFSIRHDFFGLLVSEFETAIPTFFNDCARFNLQPLSQEEAREAIIKPLKHVPNMGYKTEFVDEVLLPGLMVEATGSEQIEPPHLQIICNRLYEAARERYGADLEQGGVVQIDHELYSELGKTQGILRDYLDDYVERIVQGDPDRRYIVRSTLKLMTETVGTRKFLSLADIQAGLLDVSHADIEGIIRQLIDGRVVEARGQGERASYSLSHEFMVEKVQSWYDEREMRRKKAQETLERGLAEWKSTKALLSETQVTNIRKWLGWESLSEAAKQLLTDSQQTYEERKRKEAEQERRLRTRTRIIWSVIGFAIVIAGVLTFWALESAKETRWQAKLGWIQGTQALISSECV